MDKQCCVIKDLLPLYTENMVSEGTKSFVEEHLKGCEECRIKLEQMQAPVEFVPDTNTAPLKNLKKKLLMKRIQTIVFTAALVFAVVISVFSILTSPGYFPYSNNLLNVMENPNGTISISFDDKVTGYSSVKELDHETGLEVYRISAWNTIWDMYFSDRGKQNMVILPNTETDIQIYYTQNNGTEDVLIYGSANADEGVTTLPRLILMPYFLLALFALVILIILRFLMRNRKNAAIWIDRLIPLPVSYMLAHLCTKMVSFKTYSSQRDFFIIILVAVLLYCAILTGISLYKSRTKHKE